MTRTIEPFPIARPRPEPLPAKYRPQSLAKQLLLLSCALNLMTLIVVAHLSHTLLNLVQDGYGVTITPPATARHQSVPVDVVDLEVIR